MNKLKKIIKEHKIFLTIFLGVILSFSLFNVTTIFLNLNKNPQNNSNLPLKTALEYKEFDNITHQNTIINEEILIRERATVYIINSTVQGSIYVIDFGTLFISANSNITGNVICSDNSNVNINNSTIGSDIQGRDHSTLVISSCQSPSTKMLKFNSANLTIINCTLLRFSDFGIEGDVLINNSLINTVALYGLSRTSINNSTITVMSDFAIPFNIITGPIGYGFQSIIAELGLTGFGYQTSENSINFTWTGWDNPIIDGFMNVTFQILLDGQLYAEIDGSGYHDTYSGSLIMDIPIAGEHNITLISIDKFGNNYTSEITIEIIKYPAFQWPIFLIGALIAGMAVFVPIMLLRYKQKRGYFSSLPVIFKKELIDSKVKILIFMGISAAPGIILLIIFSTIKQLSGMLGIDTIRLMISMILSFFYLYFGMAFSIFFTATSIINSKKNGSLSWFLSKPARRWEILWGKTLTFLLIVILLSMSSAISIVLSGIFFVEQSYIMEILSIGGYVFIIGIITLIPITTIGMLLTSISKKPGLAIFIPILLFMVIPAFISFLPILFRNEWPLLLSFSYYGEQLGMSWISNTGGGISSLTSSVTQLIDIEIISLNFSPTEICLILIIISVICLTVATFFLKRIDIT
ncbi:MAG: ABC transporter permease [Promethearchaeota archaeon]